MRKQRSRYGHQPWSPVMPTGLFALFVWLLMNPWLVARPFWITEPKVEDTLYVYRLGHAEGLPSATEAEQAAYRDALLRILRTHRSDIQDPDRWPMQRVTIVPGCSYHEQTAAGYTAWVQIMWPKSERTNLVEQISLAEKSEQQFEQARNLIAEGNTTDSRAVLLAMLVQQGETPSPVLSPVELQFQVARSWHIENRPIEARQWYERVLQQFPDDPMAAEARSYLDTLPPPARLWPMYARFGGGPIGLVMVISQGDDWRVYRDLGRTFAQEFRAAGIDTVDWTRRLEKAVLQDLVEDGFADRAGKLAEAAPVGLLVAVELDPTKKGATQMVFGTAVPVMDTRIRVVAFDLKSVELLYEESLPALSGSRSSANFAEYIANVVINDHLLPHCPGLERQSGARMLSSQ